MAVLHRVAWLNKAEPDATFRNPCIKRPSAGLTAIVEREPDRLITLLDHRLKRRDYGHTRSTVRHRDLRTFSGVVVNHREAAKPTTPRQTITHNINALRFIRRVHSRSGHARDGEAFLAVTPHGESLQAIETLDAFIILGRAVAPEPPMQPQHTPAGIGGGELPQSGT